MNQFARPGLAVTELPSFNENDKGKVLTINSESGALGWEEGGGGSSGGGVLVVNAPSYNGTLDKTWTEIHDADFAVLKLNDGEVLALQGTYSDEGEYGVQFWCFGMSSPYLYTADNPNGYPSYTE